MSGPSGQTTSLRAALAVSVALLATGVLAPASAGADTQVSSNWSGYVATGKGRLGGFAAVSGTWTVPEVTCSAGRAGYSAVWVGLGGYHRNAQRLEQLGTDANCTSRGAASYAAWYEILPASPVSIHVSVHADDVITAAATVSGRSIVFRLDDLTTGVRYTSTRRAAAVDVSSAEWIVEAPSECISSGHCESLPLASIAPVQFSAAVARSGTQKKPAGDAAWKTTALKLEQESISVAASNGSPAGAARKVATAAPSAIAAVSGGFTVSISEQTTQLPVPAGPTLPGFGAS